MNAALEEPLDILKDGKFANPAQQTGADLVLKISAAMKGLNAEASEIVRILDKKSSAYLAAGTGC